MTDMITSWLRAPLGALFPPVIFLITTEGLSPLSAMLFVDSTPSSPTKVNHWFLYTLSHLASEMHFGSVYWAKHALSKTVKSPLVSTPFLDFPRLCNALSIA